VNPIRFATERGIPEAEGIDLFLHATANGLFGMDWATRSASPATCTTRPASQRCHPLRSRTTAQLKGAGGEMEVVRVGGRSAAAGRVAA
jgi:hypothetical protein